MKKANMLRKKGSFSRWTASAVLCGTIVAVPTATVADQIADSHAPAREVRWKELFSQLFVWNIQKNARATGQAADAVNHRIERSLYFAPGDFNAAYDAIMEKSEGKKTNDAFMARETVLGNRDLLRRKFMAATDLNHTGNLDQVVAGNSDLWSFLELLTASQGEAVKIDDKAYFSTAVGQAVQNTMKDYLLVLIPGFGSHTIKIYSYAEMIDEANARCGRAAIRPVVSGAPEGTYISSREYHAGQACGDSPASVGFDVVHPMGNELGNSMGQNLPVAEKLAQWIKDLPEAYKDKKLMLLGYSKGAPISFALTAYLATAEGKAKFPGMHERVRMLVTAAGVVQGAIAAEGTLETIQKNVMDLERLDHVPSMPEVATILERRRGDALALLAPALGGSAQFLRAAVQNPALAKAIESLTGVTGSDLEALLGNVAHSAETLDVRGSLAGVNDMTPFEMIRWHLKHMNDDNFAGKTIFNFSIVTNVKDFLDPAGSDVFGPRQAPLIAPQLIQADTRVAIDWPRFSLDNIFLHLTSLTGFSRAPAGLFDTQVAWPDTKSMALDNRPLSASLSAEQLASLRQDTTVPAFSDSAPRKTLVAAKTSKVNSIDLGDFRGSHWDVAFRQVYTPRAEISKEHYVHSFPRSAFYRALLETASVYELMTRNTGSR